MLQSKFITSNDIVIEKPFLFSFIFKHFDVYDLEKINKDIYSNATIKVRLYQDIESLYFFELKTEDFKEYFINTKHTLISIDEKITPIKIGRIFELVRRYSRSGSIKGSLLVCNDEEEALELKDLEVEIIVLGEEDIKFNLLIPNN
ncbi:hypothetical protein SAMN02745174_01864 [Cetobacterium ceti]|uniref:Uncharacterized protein n=1 Tax=Cetobacterium ceti TaxID=180163 RepID=A0A1T4PD63_9FUSO|nr:hypothetical protein [Cetobacterium ceti]SJZ89500.1 hypothetical protein SAMN02745174_01864 [Cetobacterium ceti]